MTGAPEWTGRVGNSWAEEWRRTDRSFGRLTDRLLDAREIGAFDNLLDIGCGAGELVARLAPRHPGARLTGLDISSDLLTVARQRCAGFANARFEEADAARWTAPVEARPDLLISRHGVMFFADPTAAFAHLREEAAPRARLRFSCFRAREDNRWVGALAEALRPEPAPVDPHMPGPFAFADRSRVLAILGAAGWRDVAIDEVDYAMVGGEGANAIGEALAFFQRIGPAARALAELPEAERPAVHEKIRAILARYHSDGQVALPAACWIVTARAP